MFESKVWGQHAKTLINSIFLDDVLLIDMHLLLKFMTSNTTTHSFQYSAKLKKWIFIGVQPSTT